MFLYEIEEYCANIPIFRGVFLRDNLPESPNNDEICVLNLDSIRNNGSHWTLFCKNGTKCFFFDSFGHHPPIELMNYFKTDVWYSTFVLQELGTKYCGHLCVILAHLINEFKSFPKAVYHLVELLDK